MIYGTTLLYEYADFHSRLPTFFTDNVQFCIMCYLAEHDLGKVNVAQPLVVPKLRPFCVHKYWQLMVES